MMFLHKRATLSLLLLLSNALLLATTNVSADRLPRARRLNEMIKKDVARYRGILHHVQQGPKVTTQPVRRIATEEEAATPDENDPPIGEREPPPKSLIDGSVKLPMYSGADYEMGQYLVDVELGTPPKKMRLIADTGSDLTWVKCKNNLPANEFANERGFEAALSKTFEHIPCATPLCMEEFKTLSSINICPTPDSPCLYDYRYGDNDLATKGMFAKETASLPTTTGKIVELPNVLVGCSETYSGRAMNMKEADGLLGLGANGFSFSILAVNKFGAGIFSYCLVDHLSESNRTSYLMFGKNKEKAPSYDYTRYTDLRISAHNPFYWVNVKGISLGHQMLDIPPLMWRDEEIGGTILDSGSSLTHWSGRAYRVIMDAMIKALEKDYPKMPDCNGDGRVDFEYCFNTTSHPFDKSKIPRLEIHFNDGARFKPHVKSYIIDDSEDVKCIGFLEAIGGMNIIGNIMQQNYLWEFDLHRGNLGFYASTCT